MSEPNPIDAIVDAMTERVADKVADRVAARLQLATADILTAEAAAELLRCSVGHVQKLARERRIPAHNIALDGTEWRFLRSELLQWMRDRDVKPLKVAG